jgi:hypothetical protein
VKKLTLLALLLAACSGKDPIKMEQCHNGVDDDGNGLIDCADPACASDMGCKEAGDAGYYGSCPKCGQTCANQSVCVNQSWAFDTPLAQCSDGYCRNYTTSIEINVQLDTAANWTGTAFAFKSSGIRLVSKTAIDGSAVTCASLAAAASSKTQADQIETSNHFNLVGYDSRKLTAAGGDMIPVQFVNVNVGSDYLLWAELWAGSPDSVTHLPTGNRLGWGCWESGATVAPIVGADNCAPGADAGTCRTIEVEMPAPQ